MSKRAVAIHSCSSQVLCLYFTEFDGDMEKVRGQFWFDASLIEARGT
jgi:hypothetical protein